MSDIEALNSSLIIGLPWCVAATVLCLGHVDSLKVDSESSAPGETPQFVGVREQRVTGICVFILTGLSVKLAPILKFIPMPVLYGVLMFMGVNTLNGMQFIDRCLLFFMPAKHQPDAMYLRHVPLKKVCIKAYSKASVSGSISDQSHFEKEREPVSRPLTTPIPNPGTS